MHASQHRVRPTLSPVGKKPNQSLWSPPASGAAFAPGPPRPQFSIIGLNIVLSPQASWPRRVLWLLVLGLLLAVLSVQVTVPIGRLVRGGTTWQFSRRRQDSVGLPALTICHNNKFKKTAIDEMSVPGAGLLDWLSGDTPPFSLLDWSKYNLDEFFEAAGYSWDDMVAQCRIEKNNCLDVGIVRTVQSPMLGQCATLVTNASVQSSLLGPQVKIALSENGSFGKNEHDGWTLFMHQSDVVFNDLLLYMGLAKPVKLFANSSITVTVDTNLNILLPGTGKCGDATAPEYQTCVQDCIYDRVNLDVASCRIPWINVTYGQPPCTIYQEFVSSGLPQSFNEFNMSQLVKLCPCTQPCSWLEYVISTPYRVGVGETRGVLSSQRPGRGHLVSQVELWFLTNVQTTEEREAYPLSRFISEMGGSLGLMIGASLLTIVELLEYLVLVCVNAGRERWGVQ